MKEFAMISGSFLKLGVTSGVVGCTAMIATLTALDGQATASGSDDEPATIVLLGTVRDFDEAGHSRGHPDFEIMPDAGFGHYVGNVRTTLSDDGKPIYSRLGHKVQTEWRDEDGHAICPCLTPISGDQPGAAPGFSPGGITSGFSFDQWFRDTPGTNMSAPLAVTLVRQDNGTYVFDDKDDPLYSSLGGFFPVEDQLFGNPGGSPDRNFHFTFELSTVFTYKEDDNQTFKFIGDDDVWVFIDGKLVIDLGGIHSATTQYVDLSRLGLTDDEEYTLDFFFAERHRTQSNFRIETNIRLESNALPAITAAFD